MYGKSFAKREKSPFFICAVKNVHIIRDHFAIRRRCDAGGFAENIGKIVIVTEAHALGNLGDGEILIDEQGLRLGNAAGGDHFGDAPLPCQLFCQRAELGAAHVQIMRDRKSTRLNSSHP